MKSIQIAVIVGSMTVLSAATIEALWLQHARGRYDWRAYFASGGDMLLRLALGLLPFSVIAGVFAWLWSHRWFTLPQESPCVWALLFVGQEFCYYWMHRADHRIRWMWATHSVHHSPTELNLSAAYRLGWTARLGLAPLFFAPLVLLGFPPLFVGSALALNLLYQFWLHATWIPRLGPLEWFMNTPAHHRVHHASNHEYLDSNFGGVLIIFDRCFGTLRIEQPDVNIRYGLVEPIASYNPIRIGLHEWTAIVRDLLTVRTVRQAATVAFGPPTARSSKAGMIR